MSSTSSYGTKLNKELLLDEKKGCRNAALFFAHMYGKIWFKQNLTYFPYKKEEMEELS